MIRFDEISGKTVDIVDALVAECGRVWKVDDIADDMRLRIGIEEIVENIVMYAYGSENGWFEADILKERILVFRDGGSHFNPTTTPEIDVNLPLEKRRIGGMGIFIAGKYFDLDYERKNDINCLTMHYKL